MITAGGIEPVIDDGGSNHSIFADVLISKLKKYNKPFTSLNLFNDIRDPILKRSIPFQKQTPFYGELVGQGHEGPDFVFFPKSTN